MSHRAIGRSSSPGSISAAIETARPATRLPRLVREVGAVPGFERLRLSSIEINHVDAELVSALRETPNVSPHLHVPLQSGDDGVLRDMARRYTSATFLRRLEPLADFNLTTDAIVGFPTETSARSATRSRLSRQPASQKSMSFRTRRDRERSPPETIAVAPAVKKDRSARLRAASRAACLARWREKIGADDVVLVDRPGRGYGDDYSPWLVEAA